MGIFSCSTRQAIRRSRLSCCGTFSDMISNDRYPSSGRLMDVLGKDISFGDIIWQYSVSSFISNRNHVEPSASLHLSLLVQKMFEKLFGC